MGYTVPTTEPLSARAGDTWAWRREDMSDWPASSWTLTYSFRNSSAYFDVTASADSDVYAISVPAATTAEITAGAYDWWAFVSAGSGESAERYQVGTGRLEVLPDILAETAYDGRPWARRMLDYVEAALEGRASSDQLDVVNIALADRSIARDRGGLMTLRNQLQIEVKRAEQPGTASKASRVVVRWGASGL